MNHGQPIESAWRCTLREFIMVANFKDYHDKRNNGVWDEDKLVDFKDHLRNLGITL